MSSQQQKCAVCSAYLFDEDDVVHCPICGAPHHRDCFNTVGHCGLEQFHGTENEYKPNDDAAPEGDPADKNDVKSTVCPVCGELLSNENNFCPNCGAGRNSAFSAGFQPPFSVIKDDTLVAEDVTAKEAAKIVTVNGIRYLPKFKKLNSSHKTSWNWAAFLWPGAWFAYRKMYKFSIIVTLLMVIPSICMIPFNLSVANLPLQEFKNYAELASYYAANLSEIGYSAFAFACVGTIINLLIRVVSALFADWFYRGRVVSAAHKLRTVDRDEVEATEKKLCSVSILAGFLALIAAEALPYIVSMFISI